jgi:hypothetical protein
MMQKVTWTSRLQQSALMQENWDPGAALKGRPSISSRMERGLEDIKVAHVTAAGTLPPRAIARIKLQARKGCRAGLMTYMGLIWDEKISQALYHLSAALRIGQHQNPDATFNPVIWN